MASSSLPILITSIFIPDLWVSVGSVSGNFLKYPVGQSNQTLTGTTTLTGATTATGLITANGGITMGGANNITLGSGATAPTVGQLGYTVTNGAGLSTIGTSYSTFASLTLNAGVYLFISKINFYAPAASSTGDFDIVNFTASVYYSRTAFAVASGTEYDPIVTTLGVVTGANQVIQFNCKLRTTTATVTSSADYTALTAIRIA